eukprot:scaffold110633_cov43-Prasinocladus_malaysianus.AAC.1
MNCCHCQLCTSTGVHAYSPACVIRSYHSDSLVFSQISLSVGPLLLSWNLSTLLSSPRTAPVAATAPRVQGTRYNRAGWPKCVILLASKAT